MVNRCINESRFCGGWGTSCCLTCSNKRLAVSVDTMIKQIERVADNYRQRHYKTKWRADIDG